jgi:hypothetical protein
MAYKIVINTAGAFGGAQERQEFTREMDSLRAELDDIRTKYTALRALLAAGTAPGAAYNTGTGLTASQFTPT